MSSHIIHITIEVPDEAREPILQRLMSPEFKGYIQSLLSFGDCKAEVDKISVILPQGYPGDKEAK